MTSYFKFSKKLLFAVLLVFQTLTFSFFYNVKVVTNIAFPEYILVFLEIFNLKFIKKFDLIILHNIFKELNLDQIGEIDVPSFKSVCRDHILKDLSTQNPGVASLFAYCRYSSWTSVI